MTVPAVARKNNEIRHVQNANHHYLKINIEVEVHEKCSHFDQHKQQKYLKSSQYCCSIKHSTFAQLCFIAEYKHYPVPLKYIIQGNFTKLCM